MVKSTKRSIRAVVAGVLAIILVPSLVDIGLHVASVCPGWDQPLTDWLALLASSSRLVICIGGAYLTARLAPDRPMRHGIILGYMGTALGLEGVITTWNAALGLRWYPISLAVLALPQCWAGGKPFEIRQRSRPA